MFQEKVDRPFWGMRSLSGSVNLPHHQQNQLVSRGAFCVSLLATSSFSRSSPAPAERDPFLHGWPSLAPGTTRLPRCCQRSWQSLARISSSELHLQLIEGTPLSPELPGFSGKPQKTCPDGRCIWDAPWRVSLKTPSKDMPRWAWVVFFLRAAFCFSLLRVVPESPRAANAVTAFGMKASDPRPSPSALPFWCYALCSTRFACGCGSKLGIQTGTLVNGDMD